jgi:Fe(3+) dicitrate transport protein
MPEVSGTEITVTKKATVIKLNQQPPVEDNNLQELFTKAPGFLITEQHTPGQFNFSYRGLAQSTGIRVYPRAAGRPPAHE